MTAADGSCHWMDVADLCCKQQQQHEAVLQQLDQQQAVITAVKLPLPITPAAAGTNSSSSSSGSVSFWSHKLTTHRYSNEHAAVNASIWLQAPANNSSSSGPDAAGAYTLRIAVGTYQQQPGSSDAAAACNGTSSLHTTGQQQQQQTQGTRQPHSEGSWVCTRAHALEAALLQVLIQQQQQGAQLSLLQVLADAPELLLQDISTAGRLADYVRWGSDISTVYELHS